MTGEVEVEVKRSVADPGAVRALMERGSPGDFGGFAPTGPARAVDVVDRYIDTADGALEAVLLRARLRHVGDDVLVTLKGAGVESAGITTRRELEAPAADDLDPARWPPSSARTEIAEAIAGRQLVEIARLRQQRFVRDVVLGESRVELSLDHLEAMNGAAVVADRWELEAELKAGSEAGLGALVEALDRIPGVGPALGSKRGFALAAATRG